MTSSYDSNRDKLNFADARLRPMMPARDAFAVTPDDTLDLPFYGKLYVFNAGTGPEVIRVVTVAQMDDSQHVDIKVPVGPYVIDWLIVRAVRTTGTGADVTAWVLC
jgi:hypothetical protein